MKYKSALILMLLAGCQTAERNEAPRLGERISLPKNSVRWMIASGQISPSTNLTRSGIVYRVAVSEAGRIIYVSPLSPSFNTPEGLGRDSTLAQVLAAGGSPLVYETGWAYFSELPSGWCAVFYGMTGGEVFKEPVSSTKVDGYFKRK